VESKSCEHSFEFIARIIKQLANFLKVSS